MRRFDIPFFPPDVRMGNGVAYPALMTYYQSPEAILNDDGSLWLTHDCGAPGVPEANWGIRYPAPGEPWYARPEHVHFTSADGQNEGETGLYAICRTPEAWPADRRWLLAWSGAWQRDWGQPRPYRVWVGLATAPGLRGPWTRHQEGIVSTKRVPGAAPPSAWWPNGTWAVGPLVHDGQVYVVVRDNSAALVPPGPIHLVYAVAPDLSVEEVGALQVEGAVPQTWLSSVALAADGGLFAIESSDPGSLSSDRGAVEYATEFVWNPRSVATMKPTSRVYRNEAGWKTGGAGYLKTPEGGLVVPRLVLADATRGNDWTTRGTYRLQGWDDSEDGRYAARLAVAPAPHWVGPEPGLVWQWAHDPDLALSVSILDGEVATVEWNGATLALPSGVTHPEWVSSDDGKVRCFLPLRHLFDGYGEATEPGGVVTVRGRCVVAGNIQRQASEGGGWVQPVRVDGRW